MNHLLYYLMQVVLASGLLYGYYHIVLRNKKFHQYNRFYLLGAITLSILIPFLNIPVYFTSQQTHASVVLRTLAAISLPDGGPATAAPVMHAAKQEWSPASFLYYVYVLLGIFLLVKIIVSLFKIRSITRRYTVEKIDSIRFVNTCEPGTPYSFFRWLFWNQDIDLQSRKGERIFRHELFHIRQQHSLDVLFIELVTAVCWLNPFFYLLKKELRTIHEFLADQHAMQESSQWDYAELLLMQALQTNQRLVNPFFYNQIKRRIAMITNPTKTSHQYLRKLLVLPLAAVVVGLVAFRYKNRQPEPIVPAQARLTVVIDPGHGGTDPGALSPDSKYDEAGLTLELAKTIQALAPAYNIDVVMTREDGAYPGNATNKNDGLIKRVAIAEQVKADAFISLHMNVTSAQQQEFQQSSSGIEAYVAGKRADDRGKLLATGILQELSKVYKTSNEWKSRKELGVMVLDKTSCPAVLIECGYINNAEDLAFITSASNQEKVAKRILQAIVNYKKNKPVIMPVPAEDTIPKKVATANVTLRMHNKGEEVVISADSVIIHTTGKKDTSGLDLEKMMVMVNSKPRPISFFTGNLVVHGNVEVYDANNPEAISKYGQQAAGGLIVADQVEIVPINKKKEDKGI